MVMKKVMVRPVLGDFLLFTNLVSGLKPPFVRGQTSQNSPNVFFPCPYAPGKCFGCCAAGVGRLPRLVCGGSPDGENR